MTFPPNRQLVNKQSNTGNKVYFSLPSTREGKARESYLKQLISLILTSIIFEPTEPLGMCYLHEFSETWERHAISNFAQLHIMYISNKEVPVHQLAPRSHLYVTTWSLTKLPTMGTWTILSQRDLSSWTKSRLECHLLQETFLDLPPAASMMLRIPVCHMLRKHSQHVLVTRSGW